MKHRSFGALGALAAGLVFGSLQGCGGGSTSPTSPVPSPTAGQPVRTVLLSGVTVTVRASGSSFTNIDFPPAGKVDVTANWGGPNTIDVYVTDQSCPGFTDVAAGRCAILARAEGAARPKSVTFDSTAGKVYSIWMANRGTSTETVGVDAGVTTTGPVQSPPPAQPTPTPSGNPSPRASATPSDLAPGPVTNVKAYIKTIDTGGFEYRNGEQDANGNWVLYPGEFVVFDMTQRNERNQICNWIKDPIWHLDDPDGLLTVKGSSSPFFFKVDVDHKGFFELWGEIDGIESNHLNVVVVSHGE